MQAIGFCGMQKMRNQAKDGQILVEFTLDFKMDLLRAAFSLVSFIHSFSIIILIFCVVIICIKLYQILGL